MKKNRILAILIMMIFLLGIVFSYRFIIENAHHDCTGETCPICMEIEQAVQFVSHINAVHILLPFVSFLGVLALSCVTLKSQCCRNNTLIFLKVEMLN